MIKEYPHPRGSADDDKARDMVRQLFKPCLDLPQGQSVIDGLGVHPGAAVGYLICRPETFEAVKSVVGEAIHGIPFIYAIGDGSCADLEGLSCSKGLISSNPSPNAWCSVQAKCEGLPTVIGVKCTFVPPVEGQGKRVITLRWGEEAQAQVAIAATRVTFARPGGDDLILTEGDLVAIDGDLGFIMPGDGITVRMPPARRFLSLLSSAVREAIDGTSSIEWWDGVADTTTYRQNKAEIESLWSSPELHRFLKVVRQARAAAPLKAMAAGHTLDEAIRTRLFFSDYEMAEDGRITITPTTRYSGVGLLRTERIYRSPEEVDAIRTLILGPDIASPEGYAAAEAIVRRHEREWLAAVLRVNSGCPTVVRALCMPLNKLFPSDIDLARLEGRFGVCQPQARRRIDESFREAETFHGCRGARMHMLRQDLTALQIENILSAAAAVADEGGDVRLTILVAMVTFPEEIRRYVEIYDAVYERLAAEGLTLPKVQISVMVETSAAAHAIEHIASIKGKHVTVQGCLFGGNDFTAATLNMNRQDAVRAVIPKYMELGILDSNPFLTIHAETVGRNICQAAEKMQRVIGQRDLLIGIGGEQSSDWTTIGWLTRHAVPAGLSYVATTADNMMDVVVSSAASSGRLPEALAD